MMVTGPVDEDATRGASWWGTGLEPVLRSFHCASTRLPWGAGFGKAFLQGPRVSNEDLGLWPLDSLETRYPMMVRCCRLSHRNNRSFELHSCQVSTSHEASRHHVFSFLWVSLFCASTDEPKPSTAQTALSMYIAGPGLYS